MIRAASVRKPRKRGSNKDRTARGRAGARDRNGGEAPADSKRDLLRQIGARMFFPILIVAAGLAAYHNSFAGTYVLDDDKFLLNNARIREVFPLSKTMRGRRPIVDLTLAVNYKLSGGGARPAVDGFHRFNLVVHLFAGLALFGIVRRTLSGRRLGATFGPEAAWLALIVALIWVVHPLQTQSVTYLIQRGESLMGLFYLLTLYCVIRGAGSTMAIWWYFWAVVCCALGMGSKGVMVTAPALVLLYDRVFISKSLDEMLRRRWHLYAGLTMTWGVLALCGVAQGVLDPSRSGATVGFGLATISPVQYLLTQPGTIVHYLLLSVWPHPLCLDYNWPVAQGFGERFFPSLATLLLIVVTIWGLVRKPALGFVGLSFFLILSPTSSFIPIKDPAFEHRMYLPLAAVVVVLVIGGRALLRCFAARRRPGAHRADALGLVIAGIAVALLISVTVRRNRDYHSDLRMWRDVVAKRPSHPRGHLGLGTALFSIGERRQAKGAAADARQAFKKAERAFTKAVRLRPNYPDGNYNLGNALSKNGKLAEAVTAFRKSLRYRPRNAKCHYNLANTLKKQDKLDEAVAEYRKAIEIDPRHISAHINLGNSLKLQGLLEEAVVEYDTALRLNPRHANAHYNLGDALRRQGKLQEALEQFELALKYNPSHGAARISRDAVEQQLAR